MITLVKFQKLIFLVFLTVAIFLVFGNVASAQPVVRSGASVSVANDETVNGNFYSAANILNVSGTVDADMVSAGYQTTINGSVAGDALLIAARADVHGSIGDDLRVVAGVVTIAEPVMGDVLVIGGSVDILSTASVAGDVLIYAGRANIAGSVGGNIVGIVEDLKIDAQVVGDVDVTVTSLTLGSRAVIDGSVKYTSTELLTQALEASVKGEMVKNDPVLPGRKLKLQSVLIPMLISLFSVLVWYLLGKSFLHRLVTRVISKNPRPILVGLTTLIFAPLAIGVLLVSVIGVLVGVIGLFGYVLLLLLSFVGAPIILGHALMKIFNQPTANLSLVSLVVGVVAMMLLLLLPVIGSVILIGLMLLALGGIVDVLLRSER